MRIINESFDQDMLEIMEVIAEKLKEKYINPFEDIVKTRNECLKEHPAPEVSLLNSLKPFVDDKCCDIIDRLISSYNVATLTKVIAEDLQQARASTGKIDLREVSKKTFGSPNHRPSGLSILLPLLILAIFNETH